LPLSDPKLEHCEPFNLVEITHDSTGEYIGLFRIEPSLTRRNESASTVELTVKHVFATLLDDVLFRYHQTTNWTTIQNIDYLLSQQSTTNWRRGQIDFERFFHYKYENENGLLGPMLAIPQPFDEDYQWTYDTQTYPWTLNLVRPSTQLTCEIRYAKNMREIEREVDPSNIVNRIYPLGFGEGVNQLGIEDANGGVPYLEDAASIAQYGLKAYVWADRRFEDAESLKQNAASLLSKWKQPKVVYKVSAVDLSVLTGESVDKFTEGALVRIIDPDFGVIEQRIHMVSKPDITGAPGDIQLEIGSLTDDIATVNADIERKQQVNDAYTQGATNLDSHNYVDNCDQTHPAVIRFFLPSDLVNVNTMSLSYETEKFRPYSQATAGGGSTTKTTTSGGGTTATSSSGGGTTATSSSGGGVSTSTASGGGTTQSSTSGGGATVSSSAVDFNGVTLATGLPVGSITPPYEEHYHLVTLQDSQLQHAHSVTVPSHSHSVSVPSHTHDFNVPNHSHNVTIPNHTHSVTIPDHSHDLTLPDHTHDVLPGIYEVNVSASAVTVKVDGNTVPVTSTTGNDIDIIPYLAKDAGGKVTRGTWHEVEITPNNLARINANIISRLFISSHIGGNY
jgi:phage minor structural protein